MTADSPTTDPAASRNAGSRNLRAGLIDLLGEPGNVVASSQDAPSPSSFEAGRNRGAIARVQHSIGPDVVRIRYEFGEAWSGQWANFFRIVLTDDAARRRLRDVRTSVVRGLAQQLDFPGLGVFPYHNFRSVSEQAMLQEPARA